MLYEIVMHTPRWVWAVLFVLIYLGLVQATPRVVLLRRAVLLPLAMTSFSLYGVFTGFGGLSTSWAMWAGAALASGLWVASSELPAGVRYDGAARVFHLPGSWVPLAWMMAIFSTKYAVGVMLAMHGALAHDMAVAAIVASLYGAMSGVFLGRMARLLRLARAGDASAAQAVPLAWG